MDAEFIWLSAGGSFTGCGVRVGRRTPAFAATLAARLRIDVESIWLTSRSRIDTADLGRLKRAAAIYACSASLMLCQNNAAWLK